MAPLGYLNDTKTKQIYIEKEKAALIKKAFELYATGKYTLKEIRKIINNLGLRGRKRKLLSVSNYQYLLQNPFYCGIMRYNGEYFEGRHEPIISKKLFDQCQEVMKQKSKPKTRELKPYIYRGLFRCGECGCFITTETQKGHNYLRCTKRKIPCSQKYVREEMVAEQIKNEIQKVSLPDDWANWMIKELQMEKEQKAQSSRFFAQKIESEIRAIDEKLEKIMNAYLENALSLEEYRESKNKLVNQKQLLKDKLIAIEQKGDNRFELAINFINSLKQSEIVALRENRERCRDFLKKIGSNFQILERKLFFDFKNPYKIVAFAEPERSEGEANLTQNPEIVNWRRGWDSNPRARLLGHGSPDRSVRPLRHPSKN